ncbi:cuticle protein-like [Neocloeon triangulifer]|uniref:cuticle protein-like n=1 Tax=Neocloeon triangulifer TaxID=2078957 RepID=UPI00286EF95E|nr:cuticle protein-like [Neocloeon triangulifer]
MAFKLVALFAVLAAARAGTVQTVDPFGFAAPAFAPIAAGLQWIQTPSQYGALMPLYNLEAAAEDVLNQLSEEVKNGDVILRFTFDIAERDGKVRTVAYYEEPSVIFNFVAKNPSSGEAAPTPVLPNQVRAIVEKLKDEIRYGGIILRGTFDLIQPDGKLRTLSYYEDASIIFNFLANKAPTVQSQQRPIFAARLIAPAPLAP